MPHIVVYNLLEWEIRDNDTIRKMEDVITKAAVSIPELELKAEDISCSFPFDPSVELGEVPVIVIVELLFDKPKRTYEIRQRLAEEIGKSIETIITERREIDKIEVAVKRFNPQKDGFYSLP